MKLRFGMITSAPQAQVIYSALPEVEVYCDVDIYVIENYQQAYEYYIANWQSHDAFVFSGIVALMGVKSRMEGELPGPHFCFDDVMGNLSDTLLGLLLQDRQFDFSRTFVDFAGKANDYLGLKAQLPPDQWPYFAEGPAYRFSISMDSGDSDLQTSQALERHLLLHRQRSIDLSITRYGVILDELEAHGCPYIYINTTREYVINFFIQATATLQLGHSQAQSQGCAILAFPGQEQEQDAQFLRDAGRSVMAYAIEHGLDFSLSFDMNRLQILTKHTDLSILTQGFTTAQEFLHMTPAGQTILWGLGTGRTIFQAKRNAQHALDVALQREQGVYYVSESGKLINLDEPGRQSAYVLEPSKGLLALSEQLGLDHIKLQKLLNYMQLSGANSLTAVELATCLGCTVRTANRVLTKLVNTGGAIAYENTSGKRGRPQKYYQLTFQHP